MSARKHQNKLGAPLGRALVLALALVPALCQAICLPSPALTHHEAPSAEEQGCHGGAMAAPAKHHSSEESTDHGDCCDPSAPAPSSEGDLLPEMLLTSVTLPPAFTTVDQHFGQPTIRGPPVSTGPPLTLLHCHFTE